MSKEIRVIVYRSLTKGEHLGDCYELVGIRSLKDGAKLIGISRDDLRRKLEREGYARGNGYKVEEQE